MNEPMLTPDEPGRALTPTGPSAPVPALIAAAGEDAARHFLQFFLAHIRNPHTRRAYARQVRAFLEWCARRGVADVRAVQPEHVAAYVELLGRREDLKATSVKQALAAIRMLCDWLVVRGVLTTSPAAAVRGPKLSVSEGLTPVLSSEEAASLLEAIPTDTLVGLRDRAVIGVMAYTFARVGAVVAMNVRDFYPQGTGHVVRLREKGGKVKIIAAHHLLVEYLDAYIAAAGIAEERDAPLFRTARGKTGRLTGNRLEQVAAWLLLQRRARRAGIRTALCNHTWRATGITNFLENGGALDTAQYMAGHADPRTTKLYDRRRQLITQSEVERIRYEKKPPQP